MMHRQTCEPDLISAITLLSTYETDALRKIVSDDNQVFEYIKNLPQSQELGTSKELKLVQNKSLAEYNLTLEPVLERGKANLMEICERCNELFESIEEKENQLKNKSGGINLETGLALLQTSAAESEESTEKLAELLYQKEVELEDFLDRFLDERKRMHLRRLKADKMNELMTEKLNGANDKKVGYSRPAPLPPTTASPLPYPITGMPTMNTNFYPMNMPLPNNFNHFM